jgi:protein involved in polysaccharide export with SLBB domain
MRLRYSLWLMLAAAACVCSACRSAAQQQESIVTSGPHYTVSGECPSPGARPLYPGVTVSKVLAGEITHSPGVATTLVLIRHGPEGKSRQLIQLDADGKLMDEKQDYVLRDGDELVFPSDASSAAPVNRPDLPQGHESSGD